MSNYIKKYNLGDIAVDLPYNGYIHELPLLSFKDFRNGVNISLIFNYKLKLDANNTFNIGNGFKLNIQKKIIKDNNNIPIKIIDTNGKYVNLIRNKNSLSENSTDYNNLYTFDDESKRVLRVLDSGYEIEYEDLSKEVYNTSGYILSTFDKYGDLYLTYSYENNLLKSLTYNAKVVSFRYTNNILSKIEYGTTETNFTSTNQTLTVSHYSNVTYNISISNTSYVVVGSGVEDNETVSVSKECLYQGNDIILNSKIGQDIIDTITYTFSDSVTSDYYSHDIIIVTNKTGVKQRIQYLSDKPLYSYEINENNDIEFFVNTNNDEYSQYINDINIFSTIDGSNYTSFNGKMKYSYGTQMSKIFATENKFRYDASFCDPDNTKGYYLVTGWVKSNTTNDTVTINISNYNEGAVYQFYVTPDEVNKWYFFAYQFSLPYSSYIYVYSNNSDIEFRDLKISYEKTYEIDENKVEHAIYQEAIIINKRNFEDITRFDEVEFKYTLDNESTGIILLTFSDLLRYIRRKVVQGKSDEIYYNDGKNVINNVNSLMIKRNNTNYESLSNYNIGYRYYSNNSEKYFEIERINTENKVFKIYNYEKFIKESEYNLNSIQYLNIYYDALETKEYFNVKTENNATETGEITKIIDRDKGLVTKETDNKTYCFEYIYDEILNKLVFEDENLDGTLRNSKTYYMDSVWGSIYQEEMSNNSDLLITYDDDKSTILRKEFNETSSTILHRYGYKKGKLSSFSCGTFGYSLEYNKDDLYKVLKFGNQIEEQNHTDFVSTIYYPSSESAVYSKIYNYDKYQRLISIDGELENTYDIYSSFDSSTGEPSLISSNASSKLIMTEDKLQSRKIRYLYDDQDSLEKVETTSSSDYSNKVSEENLEYDSLKRLTNKEFIYDKTTGAKVEDVITYVNDVNEVGADNRVKSTCYKINGQSIVNTVNVYNNELSNGDRGDKNLNKKQHTFSNNFNANKEYGIQYNKVNSETLKINNTLKSTTTYTYDSFDRIASITKDNKTTSYEYDGFGRLVRENNDELDKTIIYTYNDNGNIVGINKYNYTLNTNPSGTSTSITYTYDTTQKDRLINFNNTTISYNSLGCPTTHKGYSVSWSKGRLTTLSKGNKKTGTQSYLYSYNAFGQRISKRYSRLLGTGEISSIVMGETMNFNKSYNYDNSGRLINEKGTITYYQDGTYNESIDYIYDGNTIIGITYTRGTSSNTYYFERNILGDVVAIYDMSGNLKVKYVYDAYGNCTIASGTTDRSLARINPIRYRGYYYDDETGYFWLSSRYYSPELGRFIQPADVSTLNPLSINGLNLYSYANNNPIGIAYSSSGAGFSTSGKMMSSLAISGSIILGYGSSNKGFYWPNLDFLGKGFGYIENSFSMIAGVIDGVRKIKHLDKLAGLDKVSNWLMGIGIGINVGLSLYNNLTNSNLSGAQKAGNIVGDIVYIAASSAATWGVSALTAMIPVVGPFLAPVVGFGFGTALDQFWHGEDIFGIDGFSFNPGGKSIDEWIKEFFTELFGG